MEEDETAEEGGIGPQPEKPAVLDTRPNGLEVSAQFFSINDKVLGAGEPLRVKEGERVLVHVLNASAIEIRRISLPGHQFQVLALDGNAVPSPQPAEVLALGPGERVDAYVEMNHPGVWILGSTDDAIRNAGLGVIVEYASQHREAQWLKPTNPVWDYTIFGRAPQPSQAAPEHTIDMVFEKFRAARGSSTRGSSTASPIRTSENSCYRKARGTGSYSATAPTIPIRSICIHCHLFRIDRYEWKAHGREL